MEGALLHLPTGLCMTPCVTQGEKMVTLLASVIWRPRWQDPGIATATPSNLITPLHSGMLVCSGHELAQKLLLGIGYGWSLTPLL